MDRRSLREVALSTAARAMYAGSCRFEDIFVGQMSALSEQVEVRPKARNLPAYLQSHRVGDGSNKCHWLLDPYRAPRSSGGRLDSVQKFETKGGKAAIFGEEYALTAIKGCISHEPNVRENKDGL